MQTGTCHHPSQSRGHSSSPLQPRKYLKVSQIEKQCNRLTISMFVAFVPGGKPGAERFVRDHCSWLILWNDMVYRDEIKGSIRSTLSTSHCSLMVTIRACSIWNSNSNLNNNKLNTLSKITIMAMLTRESSCFGSDTCRAIASLSDAPSGWPNPSTNAIGLIMEIEANQSLRGRTVWMINLWVNSRCGKVRGRSVNASTRRRRKSKLGNLLLPGQTSIVLSIRSFCLFVHCNSNSPIAARLTDWLNAISMSIGLIRVVLFRPNSSPPGNNGQAKFSQKGRMVLLNWVSMGVKSIIRACSPHRLEGGYGTLSIDRGGGASKTLDNGCASFVIGQSGCGNRTSIR